jgi:uncharacterized protein
MYPRFSLILMVTHACNLRCSYCYAGEASERHLPEAAGRRAVDRAVASLAPGGTLELGFFGGEPLLEAERVAAFLAHARARAAAAGVSVAPCLTTNGTQDHPAAWSILTLPDLDLSISFDGLPEVHDRHRRDDAGCGSAAKVLGTMRRLRAAGKAFRAACVVRPDTAEDLADGLAFIRRAGAQGADLSLDLWAGWTARDAARLEGALVRAARAWREALPDFGVNWFDEKAARLARVPRTETARCGFGDGAVAVAPSGRLYPCERLIGADADGNPMRLPGHVLEGDDFLGRSPAPGRAENPCAACQLREDCGTTCRCSNYVRTGDVRRPDRLLCRWDRACMTATAQALGLQRPDLAASA